MSIKQNRKQYPELAKLVDQLRKHTTVKVYMGKQRAEMLLKNKTYTFPKNWEPWEHSSKEYRKRNGL